MSKSSKKPPNELFGMVFGFIVALAMSIAFDSIPIGIITGIIAGSMMSFYSRKSKTTKE